MTKALSTISGDFTAILPVFFFFFFAFVEIKFEPQLFGTELRHWSLSKM